MQNQNQDYPPILTAAQNGQWEEVSRIASARDVSKPNEFFLNIALHIAAAKKAPITTIAVLVYAGASPDFRYDFGLLSCVELAPELFSTFLSSAAPATSFLTTPQEGSPVEEQGLGIRRRNFGPR